MRHVFTPVSLILLTGVMAFSSAAAFAGERYTEVWNPPEAQTSKAKGRSHNLVPTQAKKKHKGGLTVKKIADRTTLAPRASSRRTPRSTRSSGRARCSGVRQIPLPSPPPLVCCPDVLGILQIGRRRCKGLRVKPAA